eukprot:s1973_g3.t1
MALSSLLNDKSLARFRTKPCERLVAKGHCSFGDRCQYSHASLPRRCLAETVDSVVFQNVQPNQIVKQRLRDMAKLTAARVVHPTEVDISTVFHKPEETLKAMKSQQVTASNSEETSAVSSTVQRLFGIGHALKMKTDSPEAISSGTGRRAIAYWPQCHHPFHVACLARTRAQVHPPRCSLCRSAWDPALDRELSEEQLYHPEFYKTKFCELGASCREYYCPYAHSSQEKKNKAELLTPGAVPKPDADAEPVGNAAGEVKPPEPQGPTAPEGWWFVGDQKDLLVSSKGEVVTNFYGLGHSITGGYVRQAQILVSQGGTSPCVARLLSTSRGDATVANQVIKDIRRWIAHCHSSVQMIRRTVATTVLALPAELRCLDVVVKGMASNWDGHGLGLHNWGTTSLLSKWLSQITSEVANLHSTLRISHLSLGPCSVFLDPSNEMQMGDFLGPQWRCGVTGKVQFLRNAQSGFSIKDDEWAMWYPAEVQKRIAQEGNLVPGSSKKREDAEIMDSRRNSANAIWIFWCIQFDDDEYAVDAWQLGVLAFFLLTGEHPFGASNQPTVVCGNITTHRVANWGLMEEFPLWADLIGRLLSHDPTERLKVSEADSARQSKRFCKVFVAQLEKPVSFPQPGGAHRSRDRRDCPCARHAMAPASDTAALYATAIFQRPGEASPHVDGVSAYNATLYRTTPHASLGLVVTEPKPPMRNLLILQIADSDAVLAWNFLNSDRRIEVGHALMAVNGKTDPYEMIEELEHAQTLNLFLKNKMTRLQRQHFDESNTRLHRSIQLRQDWTIQVGAEYFAATVLGKQGYLATEPPGPNGVAVAACP